MGISRTAESIHQEAVFKASRKRVYEALIDTNSSTRSLQLSGVMQTMPPGGKPTEDQSVKWEGVHVIRGIHHGTTCRTCAEPANRAGLANGRLDPGVYSIVKFEVVERAPGPRSYLTIRVFLKARRKTWRQDGKRTIGSRSKKLLA